MKNTVFFPVIFLVVVSCSSPHKLLQTEWKISDVEFMDTLNTLTPSQKTAITDNLKNKVRFSFMPDSVFQVKNENEILKGKWWLSGNSKTLFTKMNDEISEAEIYVLKKKTFRFESAGEFNQTFIFTCVPTAEQK